MGIDAELIDLSDDPADGPAHGNRQREEDRASGHHRGRLPAVARSGTSKLLIACSSEAFDYLDAPVITIAGKDVPMPYAANLEKLACRMSARSIEAVKAVTYTG
jgi:hypothetical protein